MFGVIFYMLILNYFSPWFVLVIAIHKQVFRDVVQSVLSHGIKCLQLSYLTDQHCREICTFPTIAAYYMFQFVMYFCAQFFEKDTRHILLRFKILKSIAICYIVIIMFLTAN